MRRLICAFVVRVWHNRFSYDVANLVSYFTYQAVVGFFFYDRPVSLSGSYPKSLNGWRRYLPGLVGQNHMSRSTTKPTKLHERTAKTQISLHIRIVWSESSFCALWVAKDPKILHADIEDCPDKCRCTDWSEFALSAHVVLSLRYFVHPLTYEPRHYKTFFMSYANT